MTRAPFHDSPAWNVTLRDAPSSCDVLVIGAGPAGSACARQLARAGWQVVLADKKALPRDKVCGDALVPDAIAALKHLGLHERVCAAGRQMGQARCVAPFQQEIAVPGDMIVLPRQDLDEILARGAVEAGAVLTAPAGFVKPLVDAQGRVIGAVLENQGLVRHIAARWVVLATGAATPPLQAAGLSARKTPSGFALRQYIRHDTLASEMQALRFVWHRALRGGYGWIFPGPDGVCNIGVGISSHPQRRGSPREGVRLHDLFERFVQVDPIAARLVAEGAPLGPAKGAPLRFDLTGADWVKPGLLVTGEAIGSTYRLTGEGIGKAMETGMAAADSLTSVVAAPAVLDAGISADTDAAVSEAYVTRLNALRPRFEMYQQAAHVNKHPWLISLVIWKAGRLPWVTRALADILAERRLPESILSWRGLKLLFKRR
ncbi:MAG TPA: NAD(P)/FAD-dependent oxidoreductase [Aquabacterium sp.]|uniref:NAD(P)/FAD-dependent oxidoreductase n=1 Tax=Aquabacterium sp. TaxID=1872578 RepID=UPI002E37B1F6|nr:NAD(P)/FAD-dependent oxidoreductase [Aquabacterium sp.]HEX5373623.1 NAD(P)/FAD-dependent oxidoreductase [Aquabacterium sp.]